MVPVQMRFLRLLSRRVSQNITYLCYNSRAWEDDGGRSIKMQGENEMELKGNDRTKPVLLENGCKELNDEWRQTILDINTADKEALPIIDVAPFDITNSGKKKEFLLELSPVCFYNSAITKLEN
nr:collagen alpha-2(I) chain-like [Pocillopora verrucosa]